MRLSLFYVVGPSWWVDGAGNDTLLDGDGSQPVSFSAGARPFHFRDGSRVATPTANSDFFGMCRAFGALMGLGHGPSLLRHRRSASRTRT